MKSKKIVIIFENIVLELNIIELTNLILRSSRLNIALGFIIYSNFGILKIYQTILDSLLYYEYP